MSHEEDLIGLTLDSDASSSSSLSRNQSNPFTDDARFDSSASLLQQRSKGADRASNNICISFPKGVFAEIEAFYHDPQRTQGRLHTLTLVLRSRTPGVDIFFPISCAARTVAFSKVEPDAGIDAITNFISLKEWTYQLILFRDNKSNSVAWKDLCNSVTAHGILKCDLSHESSGAKFECALASWDFLEAHRFIKSREKWRAEEASREWKPKKGRTWLKNQLRGAPAKSDELSVAEGWSYGILP
ncbi:hypothetical protein BDV96DRAFT_654682 [Lophiotrema nucula]|uniref:Uncharacterized protein n=1 Tax=Lophiotrema nucula TaxID=690887 RepID=A0A6A5YJU7_9PLEO|nr:hypothetical protein BDV96DRAFT_654682 [Lophiotrema nucula]